MKYFAQALYKTTYVLITSSLISCGFIEPALAQFELPNSSIWLVDISTDQSAQAHLLTKQTAYHNQPAFSHDGKALFYSRGDISEKDGLGYTDIYRLDLAKQTHQQITNTPTSEFSPTPIPDSNGLSVVRVQADGAQQLWSIFPDQQKPERQIINAEPVGYHLWLTPQTLALFILGDDNNRLEQWQVGSNEASVIAEDIGRSLISSNHAEQYYFLQNPQKIMYQSKSNKATLVAHLPADTEDFTRAADNSLWTGVGSQLFCLPAGSSDWKLIADLKSFGIQGITRLTFAPGSSNQLALVSNDQ